jgi:hypothetical protein
MSRPKPKILVEQTNKTTYKTDQVLASEGVWAVFYSGEPINLQNFKSLGAVPGTKVQKGFI